MKYRQNKSSQALGYLFSLILMASVSLPMLAQAVAPVDFVTTPLANSTTSVIKPNMLYVMDDSGSMGRDYMPDWANANTSFELDSSYNSLAYNPATVYEPPVNFTTGGLDITTYPSQTGVSVASGSDGSAVRNWRRVKRDPFRSTSTTNLEGYTNSIGAFGSPTFWVTIPAEFCTRADLKDCTTQATPTATHSYPAPIRWCNSSANANVVTTPNPAANACQATRITGFTNLRAPANSGGGSAIATITFTSTSSTPRVESVRVGGQEILRRRTSQSNNFSTLATRTRDRINNCTNSAWGNCTVSGYSATASGATVTIYAPAPTTATPVISWGRGSLTATTTAFVTPPVTPGGRIQTTIAPATTSYPYPGQAVKAAERADCAGTTCTYFEEMTNYANWYAYYRVRALMMKTSTSLAFKDVGNDFKLGYMTINNSSQKLNIATFDTPHKSAWYSRLFASPTSGGTPLRAALSTAGKIFADKTSLGGTFTDPMEFECQQNFTLLTTDGFWNSAGGTELDGSTMGNHDGSPALPPYYEGPSSSSNNLADAAKYYRDTDLRTAALGNCTGALGTNVCETVSSSAGPAPNEKQTMVTMTLGLGVDGVLAYTTDYKTATVGDFADIKAGTKNWPRPATSGNDISTVDDLWHAAVNGDGTYFSAKKPAELVQQLKEAIASVSITLGNGATAAASSQNPVSGVDNFFYVSNYTSGQWTGNLQKREIDVATKEILPTSVACVEDVVVTTTCDAPGSILPDGAGYSCVTPGVLTPAACAGTLVGTDCKVPVATSCTGVLKSQITRNILFNNGGVLQPFDYSNLDAAQQTTFDRPFLLANLTQGPTYTAAQLGNLTGDKLVDYLKGTTTFDESAINPDERLFRKRSAILGDLIGSEPVFIGTPNAEYGDSGYQAYKAAQEAAVGRPDVVYVGSNDGMLHAFNADTLQELWAFVPSMVIPNLWKLADSGYGAKHAFYVDGDPVVADVCVASNCNTASASDWRTILVGGLDSGGRGYYALDITNPSAPQLLWEFDASVANGDLNLGYTFGNPAITKRASDGKWVVLFASGYNNISDNNTFYNQPTTQFKPNNPAQYTGGDGIGRLFVINAATGSKLNEISTGVGSITAPSGLAQISPITPRQLQNNVTTFVYAGDLLGNIWRFNIENNTVLKFAELIGPFAPQSITTKLRVSTVGNKRIILAGTGKYLEVSDLADTTKQSIYGITDYDYIGKGDATTTLVNPRATLVEQTIINSATDPDKRMISNNAVDLSDTSPTRGWYIDFPDSGERQNVVAELTRGTLTVPTLVPEATACQPDGYSWEYNFNYKTGSSIQPGGIVGQRYPTPTTGYAILSFDGVPYKFRFDSKGGSHAGEEVEISSSGAGFQLKRSIWREIGE